ncbi:ankyrin repeat domain-containing protein [Agarivorans litoreus]|uniref:ankyrin repeat domain-containing protein n=1 Tax=Agarivorans litoreus TaxID=1510455 RepID=UPI001C7DA158|nr:ankyrin repeat domain-containing protein [Agarivorans litoreus]
MRSLKQYYLFLLLPLIISCQHTTPHNTQCCEIDSSLIFQNSNKANNHKAIKAVKELDHSAFASLIASNSLQEAKYVSLASAISPNKHAAYVNQKLDRKQAEFIKLFGQYLAVNGQLTTGQTALHLAATYRHTETLKAIFELHPNQTIVDFSANTAITNAILTGDEVVFYTFFDHLTDTKLTELISDDVITQLAGLEGRGDYGPSEISYELLKQGVKVDATNTKGQTALCLAISTNKPMTIRVLLEAGANLEHQDNNGWTPLMYAVRFGRLAIVRSLLNHPQNINLENKDGKKAIDMTFESTSFGGAELQGMIRELLLNA